MTASETSRVDEVGKVFDEMAELIEVLGGNIHVGYWLSDDDQTPFLEAINRCTDIVGGKLELQAGQRLLDIGCGAGVPAIRLGQRTDAIITGITNSKWQVGEATRRVKAAGLRGQVKIDYGDAAELPYPDEAFDAVLALQSLQHAEDRGQWLREMVRVLRPGGRVVLADFTEEAPLTKREAEIALAGALEPPLPGPDVVDIVRVSGFTVDEILPCGDRIRRSYPAYFDRLGRLRPELVAVLGEEKVSNQEQAMLELLPIYRDKIGFQIITGHKPL
jgi:cyclopropane fatty-acyl-phospholipid synthase-like methyltransferase